MSDVTAIIREVWNYGARLEVAGDRLAIYGADRLPPALVEQLRKSKRELLAYLEARKSGLAPDEVPWVHVARQVLAGEFDTGSRSLLESLLIGLRGIQHPDCQRARLKLEALGGRRAA